MLLLLIIKEYLKATLYFAEYVLKATENCKKPVHMVKQFRTTCCRQVTKTKDSYLYQNS
jgi:hypothetical protein